MPSPDSALVPLRSRSRRPRTLWFNVCPAALVLASYLERRRPGAFRFAALPAIAELPAVLADPDAVLCLSLCGLDEIHLAEDVLGVVGAVRQATGAQPKVIVGGAFFGAVSPEDFAARFPVVTHVVQGDGEEALLHLLEHDVTETVVRGSAFPEPQPFRLAALLPWQAERAIPLRRQPFHCAWNRCRFCFHTDGARRAVVPMDEFCDAVSEYYHKYGWRRFYIYDNYTEPEDLDALLRYCEDHQLPVEFDVLGMMLVKPAFALRDVLARTRRVRFIGWGLESYHQPTLKRYRKGTSLANVRPLLEMTRAAGVRNFTFILAGLPQVERAADEDTLAFLREATRGDDRVIDGIALSWFLYSPQLSDRLDAAEFAITPGAAYTLADYACDAPAEARRALAGLRTIYARFDTLDHATGRRASRDDLFVERGDLIKQMLQLPGARFDFRSYMIELETWRKVWGGDVERWMSRQPRAFAPPARELSVVQLARRMRRAQAPVTP